MNVMNKYSMVRANPEIGNTIHLTDCQDNAYKKITAWFDDPNSYKFGLHGGAGTGKSFLVNLLCKSFKGSIAITAPTHKAKKVVSQFTGRPAETLHKLLGLAPDSSLEGFDLDNIKFSKKNRPTISMHALIVLDECSMVNDDLYRYLVDSAQESKTKILFVGDDAQLPPVNKDEDHRDVEKLVYESKCFSEIDDYVVMTTPARQNPTNPLMFILYALRYDIKPNEANWSAFCFYGEKFLKSRWEDFKNTLTTESVLVSLQKKFEMPDIIYTDLYGKVLETYPNMINKTTDEGYKHLSSQEFADHILECVRSEEYANDKNYCKYMAFTNANVSTWNKYIRGYVLPNAVDIIEEGDLMTSYTTITQDYNIIFTNSEDYIITYKEEGVEQIPLIGSKTNTVLTVKGWHTQFRSINTGVETTLFVVSPDSMDEFMQAHNYFLNGARKYKKWRQYFTFKSKFILCTDLASATRNRKNAPSKDADYGYGITVHKSQGSSYDVAFVNLPDIRKYKGIKYNVLANAGVFPGPIHVRAINLFVKKLLYVAYSRAKSKAYGLI